MDVPFFSQYVSVSTDTGYLPLLGATVITSFKSVLQGLSVVNVGSKDCAANADNGFLPFRRKLHQASL